MRRVFVAFLLPTGTAGSVAHAWELIHVAATTWSRETTKVRGGTVTDGRISTSGNHSRSDRATSCALLLNRVE
jgi:hypothetical protein